MAYEWSRNVGNILVPLLYLDNGTKTAVSLDSAFIYETSGDAWICKFIAPVSQTTAALTIYTYIDTVTGSPTDVRAAIYNGDTGGGDADRPESGGSPLETTGAVDLSATGSSWVTFSFSSVSLTVGNTYFIVIDNRTATPTSNYPDIIYRGALDTTAIVNLKHAFTAGFTANGITSDPSMATSVGCAVVKTDSGALIGQPYIDTSAPWASSDDRGIRFTPSEDIVVSGATVLTILGSGVNFEINEAVSGDNIRTHIMNSVDRARGTYRFPPTTLTGGTAYDCVVTATSSSGGSGYYMGETAPPADVLACRGPGIALVYGATPGSYTVETNRIYGMALIVDDMPAIASNINIIKKIRRVM